MAEVLRAVSVCCRKVEQVAEEADYMRVALDRWVHCHRLSCHRPSLLYRISDTLASTALSSRQHHYDRHMQLCHC